MGSRLALLTCVLCFLVAPAMVWAQGPPPPPPSAPPGQPGQPRDPGVQKTGTARLSGRVTSLETGAPIRRAVVRAMGEAIREARSVSTDADGRWELRELPAGRFTVLVTKGGYVSLSYGQRRPFEPGKTVEVGDGARIDKLDIALPRGGSVAGRVVDEFGEPVTGASVSTLRFRYINGQPQLAPVGARDTTDDLGQYRLYGLPPGDYYVAAQPGGFMFLGITEDRSGYGRTFYPAASTVTEASRVTLSLGQEAQNIIISMAPSRIVNVSGTISTANGKPVQQGMVMLREINDDGAMNSRPAMVGEGAWTLSGVAPGTYQIFAQAMDFEAAGDGSSIGRPREFVTYDLTVSNEDITGIALVTTSGGTMRGRVRFEGHKAPAVPAMSALIAIDATRGGMPGQGAGLIKPDWTFEVKGIVGRRRLVFPGPPPGWAVKTILHDGTDITDAAIDVSAGEDVADIEVILTSRAPELAGTVHDTKGAAVEDFSVVVFAADAQRWGWQSRFVRVARPDQTGRFVAKGLPPGSYLAVALEYLEPGQETDPQFLERLKSAATPLNLAEGEKKTVTLKLSAQ